jgi:hypothetical protein
VRWPPAWEFVIWSNAEVVRYSLDSKDVNTEADESPLLRSVTRKQLVKAD